MTEAPSDLIEAFRGIAGEDGRVNEAEFIRALNVDPRLGRRAFGIFDKNASGHIDLAEFIDSVERLTKGDPTGRLRFAFDLHDRNGNGSIDETEVLLFLTSGMQHSKFSFEEAQVRDLVHAFMGGVDADRDGRITFDELRTLLDRHPALASSLHLSPVEWLKPVKSAVRSGRKPRRNSPISRFSEALREDWRVTIIVGLWIVANAVAFSWGALNYAAQGASLAVVLARGAGMALNLNGALILVPVMRRIIRALRDTRVAVVLPLDSATRFHRMVGGTMFGFAVAHTAAHFANYAATDTLATGPLGTAAGITGVVLFVVLVAMWVTAQDNVRKGGKFRLFFLTHLLFVVWLVFMLLHGPSFWKWGMVSIVGFVIDRLLLKGRSRFESIVDSARFLPHRVLELHIRRPPEFQFQAGDYVLVKCPRISAFEWHPFTISSAPELRDEITLHVRAEGAWTGELYRRMDSGLRDAASGKLPLDQAQLSIVLEGPYGTPSSEVFKSRVAVLVAGGIGATPFASIIESIHRRRSAGVGPVPERVYFHWVSRGQRSFDWLIRRLGQIESEGPRGALAVQVHLTGVDETEIQAGSLFVAMDLLHKSSEVDLITGLRSKSQFGRPDWKLILADIQASNPGARVDVFFCGPPGLGEGLRREAHLLGMTFRIEVF